ncbi:MAG TPA: cobalamin-dependent protein [Spirochaetota bacterium]|nr:cobalamin-dependent protein [Spirochaetota bacterium]
MKIMLIFPNFLKHVESHPELEDNAKGYLWGYASIPGLGLPHIAANTPEEHEIIFVDDQFEDIDFDAKVDLVGISSFTPQFSRAVVIANEFRKRGIPVAMGGKHITNNPDEALKYCDHVFIGESEITWPLFLEEFKQGKARSKYENSSIVDVKKLPLPKRNIVREKNYPMDIGTLVCVRGCGLYCNWCALDATEPRDGRNVRKFDFDWLLKDISNTKFNTLYIPCNTIMQFTPKEFILDLLDVFKKSGKKFMLATNAIDVRNRENQIPGFIEMMANSGITSFYYTLNEYASVIPKKINQSFAEFSFNSDEQTKRCQDAGIEIIPSIFFGSDFDTPDVFERAWGYLERNNIVDCEFTLSTPFPGSTWFKKLNEEGRLLTKDWFYYNCAHIVFEPKVMTAKQVHDGYINIWKEFFKKNKDRFKNTHVSNLFETGNYLQGRQKKKLNLNDFAHFNEESGKEFVY